MNVRFPCPPDKQHTIADIAPGDNFTVDEDGNGAVWLMTDRPRMGCILSSGYTWVFEPTDEVTPVEMTAVVG